MRILLVGRKLNYNAEFFYEKAFREIGEEVLLVDSYTGVGRDFMSRIIHTRTRTFDFTLSNYWINRHLPRIVESYDPDAVIVFKGDFISERTVEEISQNRNVYLLYPDTYKFKPILRRTIRHYNIVFTAANRRDFYYHMGARKAVTVPWACDPAFHKPMDIEKRYMVSFIGTAYLERRKIIRKLPKVDVFGDFWFGFGEKSHRSVHGEDFVRTINQSFINLNLQARISVIADAPTMRTFEVAGCGGFQISDYMPSLKKYFPMLPTFREVSELKELISYYLDNPEEAQEIANKTVKICLSSYKYIDAAKIIISNL
ncbi:MAG: glycosyltransferase [Thermoplasmatales archaeon]|jgi:spore maturation protein CgeB|nr:glycosyltransferase [Thermoplasmatales archaeon]